MKINGRLLLILFAVALFIRIWNVNGQKAPRAGLTRNAAAVRTRTLAREKKTPSFELRRTADRTLPATGKMAFPVGSEELWTAQTVPFRLPEGLAPGTYRAVSDAGRVARLSIEGTARTANSSADFVAISTETERWYLIRLKSDGATGRFSFANAWNNRMPSVPDLQLSLPPVVANRKFDFTGYVPAATIDALPATEPAAETLIPTTPAEALVQQAERPAPPELPSPL